MASTEEKVFEIIFKKKKVGIFFIAQELNFSTDYIRLICQALQRKGKIIFSRDLAEIKPEIKPKEIKFHPTGRLWRTSPLAGGLPKGEKKKIRKQEKNSLATLKIDRKTLKILKEAGFQSIEDIIKTPFSILLQKTGLELSRAAKIFNKARSPLLEKEDISE